VNQHSLASRRDAEALIVPLQQPLLDSVFEPLDLHADCRLRQMKVFSRTFEAAGKADRRVRLQNIQVEFSSAHGSIQGNCGVF
jgi:hypothetical protein